MKIIFITTEYLSVHYFSLTNANFFLYGIPSVEKYYNRYAHVKDFNSVSSFGFFLSLSFYF